MRIKSSLLTFFWLVLCNGFIWAGVTRSKGVINPYFWWDFVRAERFYSQFILTFKVVGAATKLKPAFVFAIVAPEISQFSNVFNFFEAQSLKVLNIQGGKPTETSP